MTSLADDLRAAREAIRSRGWSDHGLVSDGRICLIRGINVAVLGSVWAAGLDGSSLARREHAIAALAEVAEEQYPDAWDSCCRQLAVLNDHVLTSEDEALALFDKAILRAEAEELDA